MREKGENLSPTDLLKQNDYRKFSKQKDNNKRESLGASGRKNVVNKNMSK